MPLAARQHERSPHAVRLCQRCARFSIALNTFFHSPTRLQAQELIDKSPQMPDDVVWHFIGHLQSNKAKALVAGVPNLAVLETLDTVKLANKLQVGRTRKRGPMRCSGF